MVLAVIQWTDHVAVVPDGLVWLVTRCAVPVLMVTTAHMSVCARTEARVTGLMAAVNVKPGGWDRTVRRVRQLILEFREIVNQSSSTGRVNAL